MKVDDYRLADCALFRIPAVDVSEIDSSVEQALVDAWKNGYGVDSAVSDILNNDSLVGTLENQIADNLAFQRQKALDKVKNQAQSRIDSYEESRKRRLDDIDSTLGADAEKKEAEMKVAYEELTTKHKTYNAAQAHLEKMRAEVNSKLEEIGGREGFEAVLEINEAITEDKPVKYEAPKKVKKALDIVEEKAPAKIPKVTEKGLEKKVEVVEEDQGIIHDLFTYDIGKPIWKVLNYKLW